MNRKYFFLITAFLIWMLLSGCYNTEGIISIKGKVIDEYSNEPIPWRKIIIQGLVVSNDNRSEIIYAGQLSTDSSGCFTYSFNKIKDAYSYNFYLVGDSNYASKSKKISLLGLKREYLFFNLNRLVALTVKINRISKTPVGATLIMSLKSDGIDGRTLYPYIIENYEIDGSILNPYIIDYYGQRSNLNSIWIGENVRSIIKTRVFADKRTTIRWVLYKTMKVMEITDTITCRRDSVNEIYFKY